MSTAPAVACCCCFDGEEVVLSIVFVDLVARGDEDMLLFFDLDDVVVDVV